MFRQKINVFSLLVCFSITALGTVANENTLREGLFFYSFETEKDHRTNLALTPEHPFHFSKGFAMEFDVKFRIEVQNFGYICRIIANDTLNIDLLADYYYPLPKKVFFLVSKKKSVEFTGTDLPPEMFRDWIKVRLSVNPSTNKITLSLNEYKKELSCNLGKLTDFDVTFGCNPNKNFYTTDVAPVTVKNIRFYDEENTLAYHWQLSKHTKAAVYDECKSSLATVTNPCWLIDEQVKWLRKKTFLLPGLYYQYAFDPVSERLFIVRGKNVICYYPKTNRTDSLIAAKGLPYDLPANQLLYDPKHDELISYNFDNEQLSRFNFQTTEWSVEDETHADPQYSHHGKYYLPDDAAIVAFGGYGWHKYNSLLQLYFERTGSWEQIFLSDVIHPRYLGGMGQYDAQTFLYFGGFGSESGKQEDSPRNYYDLYSVDIKGYKAKKLWELEYAGEPFTNSNSMVIDKDRGVFYALSYSNQKYASQIILHEYLLDKPGHRTLADSIPYLFTDTKSYCDLYMNASRTSMYALVSSADRSDTQIEVYEIAYPPLPREEAEQPVEAPVARWKYVLPCILLIALLLLLYSMWKIRRKRTELLPEEDENNSIVAALPIDDAALTSLPPFSVQLLGEFKVFDDYKNNITTKMPPTTRSMFLLLLLSTLKEGCGISSVELKNRLWDDKDETSARNNRNVQIQKLRIILKDVACMEIVKQDGYWKINCAPTFYCDYTQALAYIDSLKSEGLDKLSLLGLLSVAMHGTLLSYINIEWLDEYKSSYSNSLIETLTHISRKDELKNDWNLLLKIANVILLHDATDEYAVKLKCYVLLNLKRNRPALQCFRKFVADYEWLYASKPELTFEEVTRFKM